MKKLYRLKVVIEGTKRSKFLENGETSEFIIETWIPNEIKGLYGVNDYINHIARNSSEKGDFVTSLILENIVVDDNLDINDLSSFLFNEDSSSNKWSFEANIIHDVIQDTITERSLFPSDNTDSLAIEIYPFMIGLFGFENAEPSDAIERISMGLSCLGFE